MIKLSRITFEYNSDKTIINNFNYIFNDSGLYGIIAKSGYGKTTLLNLIGGILKPSKGKITYSADIATNRSISYIFQDDNLLENLTLMENIEVVLRINKKKIDIENIDSILLKLSILEYKNTKVKDISGGERKRLSIALALLNDSKVILADEPTSSLDIDNSINIMNIFKELSKDILIIFTCHNRDITNQFSDYILDLEKNENNQIDSNNLYELQSRKSNILNVKDLFYLHKKIFRGHRLQLVFSILILSINIAILAFGLNVRNFNYNSYIKSYCLSSNINSMVAISSNEETLEPIDASYLYPIDLKLEKSDDVFLNSFYLEDFSICYARIDKNLKSNEVILTDYQADYLENCNILHFYDYREIIGKTIYLNDIELIVSNVLITEYKIKDWKFEFVYSSILSLSEDVFNTFVENATPCGYIFENNRSLESFIDYALDKKMDLYYSKSIEIVELQESLKTINQVFMYISIILIIASILWIFYISYTKTVEMKRSTQILELYGFSHINELFLNFGDILLVYIISGIIGSICSYFLSHIFDLMFKDMKELSFVVDSFKTRGLIDTILIIFLLVCLGSIGGYLKSRFRKVETHLE